MRDLHTFRFASRTRSKDNVVIIIALDRMTNLIGSLLCVSRSNLIQTENSCICIRQRKIRNGDNQAWLSYFHNSSHALQG